MAFVARAPCACCTLGEASVEQRRSSKRLQDAVDKYRQEHAIRAPMTKAWGKANEGAAEQGRLACERSAGQGDFHTASQGGLSFRRSVVDQGVAIRACVWV